MTLELLHAVEQVFSGLPAGRRVRLRDVAHRVDASIDEVEPALVHLMARGQVRFEKRRRRPHGSGLR